MSWSKKITSISGGNEKHQQSDCNNNPIVETHSKVSEPVSVSIDIPSVQSTSITPTPSYTLTTSHPEAFAVVPSVRVGNQTGKKQLKKAAARARKAQSTHALVKASTAPNQSKKSKKRKRYETQNSLD